ncbi:MAG: ankyrin repeat domain-containing protein [Verrucomicrobia bacterium]|nr:ankyrin repeat domain-containing protein [Verrucomicrobiota bacterium]
MILRADDPLAGQVVRAIKAGDVEALPGLLAAHAGLAAARIQGARGSQTVLHVVTDWPGFFPNGPAVAKLLLAAGADPNVRTEGAKGEAGETPLQYAASNDDVEVAEALVVGGAEIEARGGSIAGGTALENAIGYGCWRVARLLLQHGAKVEKLWQAAALGMTARVEKFLQEAPAPSSEEVNHAFWHACRGGYRRTAEFLFARDVDLNWIPDYAKENPLAIARSAGMDTGREALINWLRAQVDSAR